MTSEEIQSIRKQLGLTQEQLSEKLGVTIHAVRKWEQGQRQIKGAALKLLQEMKR